MRGKRWRPLKNFSGRSSMKSDLPGIPLAEAGGPPARAREVVLKGIGVSPGVAVGPAHLLFSVELHVVERTITVEEVPGEIARLEEALLKTQTQIREIRRRIGAAIGDDSASIFDAHLMVVDDRSFMEEIIRELESRLVNVDAVTQQVAQKYADALSRMDDAYLRERSVDVRDVTRRILRNLTGQSLSSLAGVEQPGIVVAHDLAPSESALLDPAQVRAFVTDLGSPTSHTAIMARGLAIPAVVGMHNVSVSVHPGDLLLVDGTKGLLIVNPTDETQREYGKLAAARRTIENRLAELRALPAETLDGYHMVLSANIELPRDVPTALSQGGRGIGLFRSEFLYLAGQALPDEDEQAEAYTEVARQVHPEPAIIRTLDLGGDKFLSDIKTPGEMNPFLGWRAIRFCLAQPELFKTQLRALLRASCYDNVQIMFPMVSNADEVREARKLLEDCKSELRREHIPFNEVVPVGVMIEVPSAALTAETLAPLVDFFSLGTNDLVQYTMAVDRVNERIAHLYEPAHPAVIKLIHHTIETAHRHGIWAGICGEMAADPLMVPLLIGLGADELSVNPAAVPLVKDVIRHLRLSDAEQLAEFALDADTGREIRERSRSLIRQIAPEVLELLG